MISAWFLSDLHLKDPNERNSLTLLRFLRSLANCERPATHLFLVGDIFDLWIGDHDFYQLKFRDLIKAILACKKAGIHVTYFEGNHDVHVKRYWEQRHGIPCYIEEHYEKLGPWLVRIEHGDLINPKDQAYLRYRAFIRKPWMKTVAQIIPAEFLHRIGDFASRKSRKRSSVKRRDSEKELRQMIRDHALRSFDQAPFDWIITGHMHIRDEWTFPAQGSPRRSINLGSWFDKPLVLQLTEAGATWLDLSESSGPL